MARHIQRLVPTRPGEAPVLAAQRERSALTRGKSVIGRLFASASLSCLIFVSGHAQAPGEVDTSGWTKYRNEQFGFEVKYPNFLHERRVTGTNNGVPLESVDFSTTPVVDKPQEGIQFFVQRGINTKGLSIDEWVAEQTKRFKNPPPLEKTAIGKRPAIWYRRTSAFGNNYDFYLPLNSNDILTISLIRPLSETKLNRTYEAIVSTIRVIE